MYKKLIIFGILFGILLQSRDSLYVEIIVSDGLYVERQLFMDYWATEYSSCSLHQLGMDNISTFLQQTFDQDEQAYSDQVGYQVFVRAVQSGNVVGYMSCEIQADGVVCIRQFALTALEQQKIFQNMIMFLVDMIPNTVKVLIKLRKYAKQSIKIIRQLGFVQNDDQMDELDEQYVWFELAFWQRHMTMWLDEEEISYNFLPVGVGVSGGYSDDIDYLETDIIPVEPHFCECLEEEE